MENNKTENQWEIVWGQFKKNKMGFISLFILVLFFLIGLYAPLLASSKPLLVYWDKKLYFPLFRYLFYPGFYTKPIDLFYNLLMFTLPLTLVGICLLKRTLRKLFFIFMCLTQIFFFMWIVSGAIKDPESNPSLKQAQKEVSKNRTTYREDPLLVPFTPQTTWQFELGYMTPYEKLNQLLNYKLHKNQHRRLHAFKNEYKRVTGRETPTLWAVAKRNEETKRQRYLHTMHETKEKYMEAIDKLPELIEIYRPFSHAFIMAKYDLEHLFGEKKTVAQEQFNTVVKEGSSYRTPLVDARHIIEKYQKAESDLIYLNEKNKWLEKESGHLKILIPALFRTFHWQDDAGGGQSFNKYIPWKERTRINRKDLMASLIFGIRISIVVGISAVALSLLIGIPLGTISGYFAGKTDLVICRLIEIWEAMPTFFMLLLVVAITQSKSLILVIGVLGIFGWTGFCRFIRSEFLKQRGLPYVLASKTLGYSHRKVMFSHILPNAIPPILTLLPFSMMAAITSEAGLSFLGLGEEGSTSWGVLMDEGRSVFPAESYLLWPPAILLTILLIAIAIVGDVFRDAIDPKMRD